ncbi:hypothetical protein JRQ81_014775 [Phrynocephalus forsythii]|uniref:Uncharacterized protein n=1 Tax=Phrynocephalus forsythii TaxID=171643 RepID=A0A9Q1B3U3_9SAUR|nr:hypothetical protein JRQ81_014775 [Phrynocephalus forsythii]
MTGDRRLIERPKNENQEPFTEPAESKGTLHFEAHQRREAGMPLPSPSMHMSTQERGVAPVSCDRIRIQIGAKLTAARGVDVLPCKCQMGPLFRRKPGSILAALQFLVMRKGAGEQQNLLGLYQYKYSEYVPVD